MHPEIRQVPEIDGSQGAFVGLVVALSVLIVVCCAAVFYLLRHHEPTDQDRVARRECYRRERTLNSSLSFAGPSTPTVGLGSLGDKMRRLWQSTTGTGTGGGERGRRGGRGWIRAGSEDELACRSDHEGGDDPELGGRPRSPPALSHDAPGGAESDDVRVVESPSSDAASVFVAAPYAYTYTDPFSKATSDGGALQQSQSPLSSPVSSSRESTSLDESPGTHSPVDDPHDDRHRSTSNGSVWTHAGSKFVEDI